MPESLQLNYNSFHKKRKENPGISRDVVTFLSVEGPNKWARGQTWEGPTIRLPYTNLYSAQNVGSSGPSGPLGDYIPVKYLVDDAVSTYIPTITEHFLFFRVIKKH